MFMGNGGLTVRGLMIVGKCTAGRTSTMPYVYKVRIHIAIFILIGQYRLEPMLVEIQLFVAS